ncbi:unnamed protein product [Clavelina lepadiformis]|uniref:Uncharacterized protein n=1 Tax=Clavelina lepadiformis TaxID=159417 RepID=A0ABP0FV79_CLALP
MKRRNCQQSWVQGQSRFCRISKRTPVDNGNKLVSGGFWSDFLPPESPRRPVAAGSPDPRNKETTKIGIFALKRGKFPR